MKLTFRVLSVVLLAPFVVPFLAVLLFPALMLETLGSLVEFAFTGNWKWMEER